MRVEHPSPTMPRVFDAHLHIIDPRFPLVANQGYRPEPFTVADYRARTRGIAIVGGAVVSGSFQAFDQAYLLDALQRLGQGFVGVTQLPTTVCDERVIELDRAGVRAVRLNLHRGAVINGLDRLAWRVAGLAGWHAELYVDARDLPELALWLGQLPQLVVDHLGLFQDGLAALLGLVERGTRVKASGFGRGDLDVPAALRAISAANPEALMFGTDLPSTRAPRPFRDTDVEVVLDTLGDDLGRRVLHDNATAFYLSRREPLAR
jgi:predicted TIM-barrel fold metal-dependent hydrolase